MVAHHMMIGISMMVIGRITNKMVMTQQETGEMIPIMKDPKMKTLRNQVIMMIQMK